MEFPHLQDVAYFHRSDALDGEKRGISAMLGQVGELACARNPGLLHPNRAFWGRCAPGSPFR
jgi:hypothetical protein